MVTMAYLHMLTFTNLKLNSCLFGTSEFDSVVRGKLVRPRQIHGTRKRVLCKLHDGDDHSSNSSSNEPPESLFMKELRRRGISPTSLLEEDGVGGGFSKRNTVATDPDKSLTNQREQSMALNREGLEGLIPRAKLLLRLGGTFFLAFWPLIIITVGSFAALYLYFGPTFVHNGTKTAASLPEYIDPYKLLEEERIIQ